MALEKPKKPEKKAGTPAPIKRSDAPNRPTHRQDRSGNSGGGRQGNRRNGGGGRGGGRGGSGSRPPGNEPSPWLQHPLDQQPNPSAEAGFVEYLRWMRSMSPDPDLPPDSREFRDETKKLKANDANTKVQLLHLAEGKANYRQRLTELTNRTKRIAANGETFTVHCPWRIRVGGHRGPESILLPAFDALGMPYIPSSTLRGVARTQAIRQNLPEDLDLTDEEAVKAAWKEADRQVARYFGHLEPPGFDGSDVEKQEAKRHRATKIIFLDAYPLPQSSKHGGLAVDMANNIWSWHETEDRLKDYNPNPNPFFSLNKATFQIGILATNRCKEGQFQQVKDWLIKGLKAGVGSQVNTGYGSLIKEDYRNYEPAQTLVEVDFVLEGQLIHGRHCPDNRDRRTPWQWKERNSAWQLNTKADAEVRPTAFKSMLRYWFRSLALGVMSPDEVKQQEAKLFGLISPQKRGWLTVRVTDNDPKAPSDNYRNSRAPDEQIGTLKLLASPEMPKPRENDDNYFEVLCQNLTWLMFHLGGIGQGARRPFHSRSSNPRRRGSTLTPETEDDSWIIPATITRFRDRFRQRLRTFYDALEQVTGESLDPQNPLAFGRVQEDRWAEAIDSHCRIVICNGDAHPTKPYALSVLHSPDFKVRNQRNELIYDKNLCGATQIPSPVWINHLDLEIQPFQVVTVFGATQNPRQQFLQELRARTGRDNYVQVWPLS